jgi:DNA-binding HxlR family transcriptional regulator
VSLTYAEAFRVVRGRRSMSASMRGVLAELERGELWSFELARRTGLVPSGIGRQCARMVSAGLATAAAEAGSPRQLGRPARQYYALTERGRELARTELHGR